jgi:hypothetical protein
MCLYIRYLAEKYCRQWHRASHFVLLKQQSVGTHDLQRGCYNLAVFVIIPLRWYILRLVGLLYKTYDTTRVNRMRRRPS